MFTGIVQAVGQIEQIEPRDRGLRIRVHAPAPVDPGRLKAGESVAVNGCCLTVTAIEGRRFQADLSEETLVRTANLDRCGPVNLEAALALGDSLGGHLVSGHVDAVGTVISLTQAGESCELIVRAPRALAPCLAFKGSVAVDGVSLTINRVEDTEQGCDVSINLIPHTQAVTTLGRLAAGSRVNLEVDLFARYAQRMVSLIAPALAPKGA